MEVQSRRPPGHARHHPLRHRSPRRPRRRVRGARARQDDDPQGQHLLALPVPGGEHHAVAARRHDPGAGARAASPIRSASRTRRSSPTRSRAKTSTTTSRSSSATTIPVLYNFKDEDMTWVALRAEGADARARPHLPRRHPHPRLLLRQEHRPPADDKCHIYTTTTGAMKNAFGGLLNTRRHYTHSWIHETLVDLLAIQKEIHSGPVRDHGRHDRRQRPRAAHDVSRWSRT